MHSHADYFRLGLGVGIVLTGFANVFIVKDTVNNVNVSSIEQIISKCPAGEYKSIKLKAGSGEYQHRTNYILCEDGSKITMDVAISLKD